MAQEPQSITLIRPDGSSIIHRLVNNTLNLKTLERRYPGLLIYYHDITTNENNVLLDIDESTSLARQPTTGWANKTFRIEELDVEQAAQRRLDQHNHQIKDLCINVIGDVLPPKLQRYIYFIEGPNEEKRGVTVLESLYCATYSHGYHVQYKVGDLVKVTNYATTTVYPTTVMKVEDPKGRDYIILKISSAKDRFPVCTSDYYMGLSVKGSAYVMPGFSAKHNGNGLRLSVGCIQTERVDSRMHILGSSGSNPGDSGCPVVARPFLADDKYLVFGMNVGSSSKGTQNPAQAHIVAAFHLWNAVEKLEAAKHVGDSEDFDE